MPIPVQCACGKSFTVGDKFAGKRGKCPACGAAIQVPAPAAPAEPADFLELADDAPKAEPVRCPACDQIYPPETAVCRKCGIDLRTGLPLPSAAGAPPRAARADRVLRTAPEERPQDAEIGLARLVLYTFIRPVATMESILVYLGRPSMLLQMGACYLASLVVVGFLGSLGLVGIQASARPDPGTAVGQTGSGLLGVGEVPQFDRVEGHDLGRLKMDFEMSPTPPVPGRVLVTRYRFTIKETGAPFTKRIVMSAALESPDEDGGHSAAFDQQLETGTTGAYQGRLEVGPPGPYMVELRIEQADDLPDIHFWHIVVVPEKVADKAARTAGRAGLAFLLAIVGMIGSLVFLLIDTATLNVAARVAGGGGGFLPMLVVLAFLSGIVNLAKIVVILIAVAAGPQIARYADFGLGLWNYGLYLLALMKVYDLDFGMALGSSILAGVLRMWLGVFVVGAIATALGLVL